MAAQTTKWKDRGFDDKQHYAGWLHFNDLVDDCRMHDDVFYDPYTGQVVNIVGPEQHDDLDGDEADKYLKQQEQI